MIYLGNWKNIDVGNEKSDIFKKQECDIQKIVGNRNNGFTIIESFLVWFFVLSSNCHNWWYFYFFKSISILFYLIYFFRERNASVIFSYSSFMRIDATTSFTWWSWKWMNDEKKFHFNVCTLGFENRNKWSNRYSEELSKLSVQTDYYFPLHNHFFIFTTLQLLRVNRLPLNFIMHCWNKQSE